MFKVMKKSFKIISISLIFHLMTPFFSPQQLAQLLIKYGETLPDYRKVRPGGVSSETGDQFANSSNCTLLLLK